MANVISALVITLIGMGVIFIVLGALWATIVGLEKVFPYKEPPAAAPDTELVAVIQAAITAYLKRKPGGISIKPAK